MHMYKAHVHVHVYTINCTHINWLSREPDRIFPETHARGKGRGKIWSGKTCQGFRIHWNVMTSKYRPQDRDQRIKVLHL